MSHKIARMPSSILIACLGGFLAACGGSDGSDGKDGEPSGPIISSVSTVGSPIYPGGQVQIFVSANSPSGEALSYDWNIPTGWTGTDNGQDVLVLTAPDSQASQAEVTVEVSDGSRTRTASVQIATRGPAIESFSAGPLPASNGDDITFATQAYNRDGKVLNYHYSVGGWLFGNRGPDWTWTVPEFPVGGRFQLEAVVQDGEGLTARAGVEATWKGVSPWPVTGGDRQRTGRSMATSTTPIVGTTPYWGNRLTSYPNTSPVLDWYNNVLLGNNNHVYSLNASTGSLNWTFTTDYRVNDAPAVGNDGTIYIGSGDDRLYAVNPFSGEEKWRLELGGWARSPAIAADGTVYVGSGDNKLYAVNPVDGTVKWTFNTGGPIIASATQAADGTVYIGSQSDRFFALDPSTGQKKWVYDIGNAIEASATVAADGTIYVGSVTGTLVALSPQGKEQWSTTLGSIRSAAALDSDGTIYIGTLDGNLYALDPADGSEKWRFTTPGLGIGGSPAVGPAGRIYFGAGDGVFYALNKDGLEQWSHADADGGYIATSPAIRSSDGAVYFTTSEGVLVVRR